MKMSVWKYFVEFIGVLSVIYRKYWNIEWRIKVAKT